MRPRARASRVASAAAAAGILLAGCATQVSQPVAVAPVAAAQPAAPAGPVTNPVTALTIPVAGAITAAQSPAVLAALQADLARRLKPETSAGAVAVLRLADGAPRVVLDIAQAFEVDSAQLRPETLSRLADCAAAVQSAGAFVVHVIGTGPAARQPDVESLAERRATSAVAYLQSRGTPASRVRAEGRASPNGMPRLELVFEPIISGREVRAWMAPASAAP